MSFLKKNFIFCALEGYTFKLSERVYCYYKKLLCIWNPSYHGCLNTVIITKGITSSACKQEAFQEDI